MAPASRSLGGEGIRIYDGYIKTVSASGAGIGSGKTSSGSGGSITISDSTVTAVSPKNGAGIGTGDQSGVSLGGGEDGDGDAFLVSGRSTVEAVAGSDGWGKAVGYGDFNVFSVPSTGSVSISNGLRVKAGKSSGNTEDYYADDRFDAICNYKYAKIYPCGHERAALKYHDYSAHGKYCADCKEWVYDSYEDHIWDDDYVCTVCGGTATLATMTIE